MQDELKRNTPHYAEWLRDRQKFLSSPFCFHIDLNSNAGRRGNWRRGHLMLSFYFLILISYIFLRKICLKAFQRSVSTISVFHHSGIDGWTEIPSIHKKRALALKPQGSLRFKTDSRDSVQLGSKFYISEGETVPVHMGKHRRASY